MSVQALSGALAIRGVSSSEKLLLLVLANYADEHLRSFPSHRRLAEDTGLTERTILSLMKALEGRGILSRQERRRADRSRSTDLITLHLGGEMVSPRGEDVAPGVGKYTAGGGEMVSPPTTFEPSVNQPVVVDAHEKPNWIERLEEAVAVAGDGLDRTSTGIMHAKDLRALCEPTGGEPCEWLEVLDAIRMCAARAKTRGKPIRSWSWVKDDALALRDKRLTSTLPPPKPAYTHDGTDHNGRQTARQDRLGRMLAGAVGSLDG